MNHMPPQRRSARCQSLKKALGQQSKRAIEPVALGIACHVTSRPAAEK
jgi:hypothetical protein